MVKLITMTTSSNTYADKIYSENPIALWALDEELPEIITGNFSIPEFGQIAFVPYLYTGDEAKAYRYGSTTDSDYGYYVYLPFPTGTTEGGISTELADAITNDQNINVDTLYGHVSSDSIPLVYGASNVAEMYPAYVPYKTTVPSILIPGKGFLNETGKFSDMTLEFWIKIIDFYSQETPIKIVGPIGSEDGLFIDKRSFILKIGNRQCSGFIKGFNRPMLIDITVSETSASLIVNGEIVASMAINMSDTQLPQAYNGDAEQDWLAFNAHGSHSINIDCVAIYNYCVPDIVAKKRFTYGQAVEHPQSVLAKHGGQTYAIDGSFANFKRGVKYPQTNPWQSGTLSNLIISDNKLKLPEYSLPEFYSLSADGQQESLSWDSFSIVPSTFGTWGQDITLNAIEFSSSVNYKKQYISFNGLPIKSSKLHSFMIQIQNELLDGGDPLGDQVLFKLLDKTSQDYLIGKIHVQNETDNEIYAGIYLKTYFVRSSVSQYSYSDEALDSVNGYIYSEFDTNRGSYGVHIGTPLTNDPSSQCIGMDISYIKENNPNSFLNGNSDNWIFYIGGDDSESAHYIGRIAKVMFVDNDIADFLPSINPNNQARFVDGRYTGDCTESTTYSLVFNEVGGYQYPDISLCGYWSQNIPFSRLCSTVNEIKTLDFVQINTFTNEKIYTDSSYQVFASIDDTATNDISAIFSQYSVGVADGEILVSEKSNTDPDFENQYVNIIVSLKTKGIFTENPFVEKIQISSRINDDAHSIGSKFGISAYPFGSESKKVLYSTYMDSTPYNYMTGVSGISLLGQLPSTHFDGLCDSGIRIPINYNNSNDFYIQSLQFYYKPIRSTIEDFMTLGFGYDSNLESYWYPLFDVYSQTSYIPNGYAETIPMNHLRVKALRVSDRLVKLLCVNISDGIETDITEHIKFTINGHNIVGDINIETIEWSVIGILFPTPLNMSGQGYSIDIIGPGVFNNIVYLKIPKDDLFSRIVANTWQQVLTDHTWNNILSLNTNWQDAYLDQVPAIYTVTPDYLYNLYQGTNRIIVASSPQKSDIAIRYSSSSLYKNVLWLSENIKPV